MLHINLAYTFFSSGHPDPPVVADGRDAEQNIVTFYIDDIQIGDSDCREMNTISGDCLEAFSTHDEASHMFSSSTAES